MNYHFRNEKKKLEITDSFRDKACGKITLKNWCMQISKMNHQRHTIPNAANVFTKLNPSRGI